MLAPVVGVRIKVDFDFGSKFLKRLRENNIDLPVIFLTTHDLGKDKCLRDEKNNLISVLIEKRGFQLFADLERAIKEFLGKGLLSNERH